MLTSYTKLLKLGVGAQLKSFTYLYRFGVRRLQTRASGVNGSEPLSCRPKAGESFGFQLLEAHHKTRLSIYFTSLHIVLSRITSHHGQTSSQAHISICKACLVLAFQQRSPSKCIPMLRYTHAPHHSRPRLPCIVPMI